MKNADGVLLVAHGTVENVEDLPEFLGRIRRGRPASEELVSEMRHRYGAIGGSPLLRVTQQQAAALAKKLSLPVLVGMRMWHPEIGEALGGAVTLGIARLCVLPLAPFSVHIYCEATRQERDRLAEGWGERAPTLVDVEPWGMEPSFVQGHARLIREALDANPGATVILSAHSLPRRVIAAGDPYQRMFEECAGAVSAHLWAESRLAYQSQGADGGDWVGPDLRTVMEQAKADGAKSLVLAPIGFVAEHVETLYDLDIEAQAWARELELPLYRVPVPSTDPMLIDTLEVVARRALG